MKWGRVRFLDGAQGIRQIEDFLLEEHPTGLVEDEKAPVMDPAGGAVGPDDAVLCLVATVAFDGPAEGLGRPGDIPGVDAPGAHVPVLVEDRRVLLP